MKQSIFSEGGKIPTLYSILSSSLCLYCHTNLRLMKSLLLYLVLLFLCAQNLAAQTDTTFTYFDANWKECKKDTATYISKIYKESDHYQRNDYWKKSMQLQNSESYFDPSLKLHSGPSTWYNEQGVVIHVNTFVDSKLSQATYFYDNGNKKALISYNNQGERKQIGWDENGAEIRGYIVEEEAHFPGGPDGWRDYLVRKINNKTAVKAGAPLGVYTVKVQFVVGKQGEIARAEAVDVPALCPPCGDEAIKIIKGSPRWKPAVQFGQPVIYQAIQNITWSVEN